MVEHIYNQEEFINKTGLEKTVLDKLIEAQVLMPAGRVDGNTPYFDQSGLDAADTITKLLDIGYSLDEVIRIRRKVGIPSKGTRRHGSDTPLLTVGELAKRIDSNPRTIKHWEEKGIIEPESYTPGGFRLYPESYVKVCQYIQDLQLFGYTLDEIKVLAELVRDYLSFKKNKGNNGLERMGGQLQQMKAQMDYLNKKIKLLEKGIERWRRLLRQRGKEISILFAKLDREVEAEEAIPTLVDEPGKTDPRLRKQKCSRRKKS